MKSNIGFARQVRNFALGLVLFTSGTVSCSPSDLTEPATVKLTPRMVATTSGQAGWSSATGFRPPTTAVQKNIVKATNNAARGKSAPPSRIGSPYSSVVPWLTDVDPGGNTLRTAINRFAIWYRTPQSARVSLSTVKSRMMSDITSAYNASSKRSLVDRIISRYMNFAASGAFAVPTSQQETLTYLGMRAMCLEWAVSTALAAGGRPNGYAFPGLRDLSRARPGMALYKRDHSHAMLIRDIYWDARGLPTKFIVAESNYGTGWNNPGGMIPWERTLDNTRTVTFNSATMIIVDFEAR